MPPRIALLDASHQDPNTVRNFRREVPATLVEFPVVDGDLPPTFDFDGIIVTGSRSAVYTDDDWIVATKEWVTEAINHQLPALGICWGHQLLADVCGGTVEPMGEYEMGYRSVRHYGDELFSGIPTEFTVFTTHSDRVTKLPSSASLIAENDYGIHGFRDGDVFGVQAHPEYDMNTAEHVVRRKDLPENQIESVCKSITDTEFAKALVAKQIFDNFVTIVTHSINSIK